MEIKARAQSRLSEVEPTLVALSHRIHAQPELAFEEVQASRWTSAVLRDHSFTVEQPYRELPTAFRATFGTGSLNVAFCAEYDALPGIGHACGHNIIAASSVGAAIALAAVADELDLTVTVIGTPAEETGSGKILLLERGGFDGVHAAMMVHPSDINQAVRVSLAISEWHIRYRGKAAHASASPHAGINAADALTVAQVAVGLLRQHLKGSERVHGVTYTAGKAPNVIPDEATAEYYVRARTVEELTALETKVRSCFEAGAIATGCTLEYTEGSPVDANVNPDRALSDFYRANVEALGRTFVPDILDGVGVGSTDMGNVTQVIPAIHPAMSIESGTVSTHQAEFARLAVSAGADRAVVDTATALAWTAIDLATDDVERARVLRGELAHLVE